MTWLEIVQWWAAERYGSHPTGPPVEGWWQPRGWNSCRDGFLALSFPSICQQAPEELGEWVGRKSSRFSNLPGRQWKSYLFSVNFVENVILPQGSKLRSARIASPFLWIFLKLPKLPWYLLEKNVDFHKLNIEKLKKGMGPLEVFFKKHFFNYFFPRQDVHWNQFCTSEYIYLNNNFTLFWMSVCII